MMMMMLPKIGTKREEKSQRKSGTKRGIEEEEKGELG